MERVTLKLIAILVLVGSFFAFLCWTATHGRQSHSSSIVYEQHEEESTATASAGAGGATPSGLPLKRLGEDDDDTEEGGGDKQPIEIESTEAKGRNTGGEADRSGAFAATRRDDDGSSAMERLVPHIRAAAAAAASVAGGDSAAEDEDPNGGNSGNSGGGIATAGTGADEDAAAKEEETTLSTHYTDLNAFIVDHADFLVAQTKRNRNVVSGFGGCLRAMQRFVASNRTLVSMRTSPSAQFMKDRVIYTLSMYFRTAFEKPSKKLCKDIELDVSTILNKLKNLIKRAGYDHAAISNEKFPVVRGCRAAWAKQTHKNCIRSYLAHIDTTRRGEWGRLASIYIVYTTVANRVMDQLDNIAPAPLTNAGVDEDQAPDEGTTAAQQPPQPPPLTRDIDTDGGGSSKSTASIQIVSKDDGGTEDPEVLASPGRARKLMRRSSGFISDQTRFITAEMGRKEMAACISGFFRLRATRYRVVPLNKIDPTDAMLQHFGRYIWRLFTDSHIAPQSHCTALVTDMKLLVDKFKQVQKQVPSAANAMPIPSRHFHSSFWCPYVNTLTPSSPSSAVGSCLGPYLRWLNVSAAAAAASPVMAAEMPRFMALTTVYSHIANKVATAWEEQNKDSPAKVAGLEEEEEKEEDEEEEALLEEAANKGATSRVRVVPALPAGNAPDGKSEKEALDAVAEYKRSLLSAKPMKKNEEDDKTDVEKEKPQPTETNGDGENQSKLKTSNEGKTAESSVEAADANKNQPKKKNKTKASVDEDNMADTTGLPKKKKKKKAVEEAEDTADGTPAAEFRATKKKKRHDDEEEEKEIEVEVTKGKSTKGKAQPIEKNEDEEPVPIEKVSKKRKKAKVADEADEEASAEAEKPSRRRRLKKALSEVDKTVAKVSKAGVGDSADDTEDDAVTTIRKKKKKSSLGPSDSGDNYEDSLPDARPRRLKPRTISLISTKHDEGEEGTEKRVTDTTEADENSKGLRKKPKAKKAKKAARADATEEGEGQESEQAEANSSNAHTKRKKRKAVEATEENTEIVPRTAPQTSTDSPGSSVAKKISTDY